MADYDVSGETVYPSQNDIAPVAGEGKKLLEKQFDLYGNALIRKSYCITGLTLPASSVDLNIQVATGRAFINGQYCDVPATTITATASQTNHVFLKIKKTSSLATTLSYEVNTTGTAPSDCIKIGKLVASGSAITSTVDERLIGANFSARIYTANDTYIVPPGVERIFVEVRGGGGGGGGGGGAGGGSTNPPAGGGGSGGGYGAHGAHGSYGAGIFDVTAGTSYAVTVGAAGTAGPGGPGGPGGPSVGSPGSTGSTGGTGGTSSLGALISAPGGSGGAGGPPGPGGGPGSPIVPAIGTFVPAAEGDSSAPINVRGGGAGYGLAGAGGPAPPGSGQPGPAGSAGTAGGAGNVVVWH